MTPGIHFDVPAEVYHADPAPAPSLSASIGRTLIDRSPRHARHIHPRLNDAWEPMKPTPEMTAGTVLHKLILGAGGEIVIVDADDYKKKAVQEARDEALDRGATPILAWRYTELQRCAEAVREEMQANPEATLPEGDAEAMLLWRDGTSWCRALVDWLPRDPRAPLFDLKTTTTSANPETWQKQLVEKYVFQAAFYIRGAARLRGVRPPSMRFIVAECDPPYGVSVLQPAPDLLAWAEDRVQVALDTWSDCIRANHWPGYPRHVAHVELPGWRMMAWEENRQRTDFARQAATPAEIARAHRISAEIGAPLA